MSLPRQKITTTPNQVAVTNARGDTFTANLQPGRACVSVTRVTANGKRQRQAIWITGDGMTALANLLATR